MAKDVIIACDMPDRESVMGFLGRWIIWALLSLITLGIYTYWAAAHLIDWVAQNSHI